MNNASKTEEAERSPAFSIKHFFKLKSTWLVILGGLIIAISPLFIWATANVSVPLLNLNIHVTITGQDAANLTLNPLNMRLTYIQFTSLALAVLVLLLRIFPVGAPRWVRSLMLIIGGIAGEVVPAYFIYAKTAQAQQLISQYQQVISLAKQYFTQVQFSSALGAGLILAILGPILLLTGGILILREKT